MAATGASLEAFAEEFREIAIPVRTALAQWEGHDWLIAFRARFPFLAPSQHDEAMAGLLAMLGPSQAPSQQSVVDSPALSSAVLSHASSGNKRKRAPRVAAAVPSAAAPVAGPSREPVRGPRKSARVAAAAQAKGSDADSDASADEDVPKKRKGKGRRKGKGKGKAAPKEKEKKQKNEIAVTKSLEQWYVGDVREAVRYWNSLNNTQRGREWQRVQGRPPPGAQRYAVFEGEDMVRSDRFLHSCDRADVPISASSVASSRTPSIAFGAPGPACPRAGDASTRRKSAWASEARSLHTG